MQGEGCQVREPPASPPASALAVQGRWPATGWQGSLPHISTLAASDWQMMPSAGALQKCQTDVATTQEEPSPQAPRIWLAPGCQQLYSNGASCCQDLPTAQLQGNGLVDGVQAAPGCL